MHFYTFLLCNLIMCGFSKDLLTNSGLEGFSPCGVGFKFYTNVNNTSDLDYDVEVNPSECCLDDDDDKCDIIILTGGCKGEVPKGESRTFYVVAPVLELYNRKGQCTVYVDYRPISGDRSVRREIITINFDTNIKNKDIPNIPDDVKKCEHIDEDPLNDCKPVNCDVHYNGKKPYYSRKTKRCVDAPVCLGNRDIDGVPHIIYNPISNMCDRGKLVTENDRKFIRDLSKSTRRGKDIYIINSQNDAAEPKPKKKKVKKVMQPAYKVVLHDDVGVRKIPKNNLAVIKCLKPSRMNPTALCAIIATQCFLICTLITCMVRSCDCAKKKVVKNLFNKGQDVSVTTPLIGTSNMDTETTAYHYTSESSNNIDKKIKCYKACQKDRETNMKLSMSDDILSKCLNRRNWDRAPRSDMIPETKLENTLTIENECKVENKKASEVKVNFQEPEKVVIKSDKSIVGKIEFANQCINSNSEKEIVCHSYSNSAFQPTKIDNFVVVQGVRDTSLDSEKAASAHFPNDSLDDFLFDRGLIYSGASPSKYTITSVSSEDQSIYSNQSSRTSKNKFVKNVISFFSRKSKGPSSEPGKEKAKEKLDLELLHISHASVCSSSNEGCISKALKRVKDSRSSL